MIFNQSRYRKAQEYCRHQYIEPELYVGRIQLRRNSPKSAVKRFIQDYSGNQRDGHPHAESAASMGQSVKHQDRAKVVYPVIQHGG